MATCQICGREIKANTGVIAHHGYTREWGMQTQSCYGARYPAYEESHQRIPEVIAIYAGQLERAKSRLQNFLENPPDQLEYSANFGIRKRMFDRPENFNPYSDETSRMGYASIYITTKREINAQITFIENELNFLKQRL